MGANREEGGAEEVCVCVYVSKGGGGKRCACVRVSGEGGAEGVCVCVCPREEVVLDASNVEASSQRHVTSTPRRRRTPYVDAV